jgi:hypothetical protein
VDGRNSIFYGLFLGVTVQGSILKPALFAIYILALFDLDFVLVFVEDIFIPRFSHSIESLIDDVKKSIKAIAKWYKVLVFP